MIINHNMNAMNAHRNMMGNTSASGKSMEKLSSGLRINRAGDDAAGLAISEKMRGQIRGLDQASRNSQDGISMIQTAEGALNETHSILQRMRELATQAANDTNVSVDRKEIQKEMNQLSSEINRIGNTTEFNTKSLLKGDGQTNLKNTGLKDVAGKLGVTGFGTAGADATTIQAKTTDAVTNATWAAGDTVAYAINGQTLTVAFGANNAAIKDGAVQGTATGTAATVNLSGTPTAANVADGIRQGLQAMIEANSTLKGQYTVSGSGANVVIEAVKGGTFDGSAGNIGAAAVTGSGTIANTAASTNVGKHVAAVAATREINFNSLVDTTGATAAAKLSNTINNVKGLVGTGITVGDKQVEFYNANDGAYTGNGIGVNISDALLGADGDHVVDGLVKAIQTQIQDKVDGAKLTQKGTTSGGNAQVLVISAATAGKAGNDIEVKDGGMQKAFEATLQVGANKGQGFKIDINDMRAVALAVTGAAGADATEGAKFTATNTVTNGTDSTTREAALDISDYKNATAAVKVINNAIENVSTERSKLGAFQNRLEHTIANLGTSSENLQAAESRVRDVDMAKEMMQFSKNNILSQASQAMLAQAKSQPEAVLQLLR